MRSQPSCVWFLSHLIWFLFSLSASKFFILFVILQFYHAVLVFLILYLMCCEEFRFIYLPLKSIDFSSNRWLAGLKLQTCVSRSSLSPCSWVCNHSWHLDHICPILGQLRIWAPSLMASSLRDIPSPNTQSRQSTDRFILWFLKSIEFWVSFWIIVTLHPTDRE